MRANSHKEVVALGKGKVIFGGTYSFHTPGTVNAPQGTFNISISEDPGGLLDVVGNLEISTLWGGTTHTSLNYHGQAKYDETNSSTLVDAVGKGIMTYDSNKKKPVTIDIYMTLISGMKEGVVHVNGFGDEMPCKLTKEWVDHTSK